MELDGHLESVVLAREDDFEGFIQPVQATRAGSMALLTAAAAPVTAYVVRSSLSLSVLVDDGLKAAPRPVLELSAKEKEPPACAGGSSMSRSRRPVGVPVGRRVQEFSMSTSRHDIPESCGQASPPGVISQIHLSGSFGMMCGA